MPEREVSLELVGITKRFGQVVANNKVSMKLYKGEILSLLGENGSGKTTLMNMISGIYFPDEGHIKIDGQEVVIRSPLDAFKHKIGMIHQHFKLIDVFTAAQNIILGNKGEKYQIKKINEKVREIASRYGFDIDPKKKVFDMSVSEKQTVEIIKALYRGANILILDEPTAVLTPQETEKLFSVIRKMKADGKSIIIITHKLNEVLAISDRVAILRKGEYIGDVETKNADIPLLTEMMVGEKVELNIHREEPKKTKERLRVTHLSIKDINGIQKIKDVSFSAYSGEILGIAGIAGAGQKELLEAIAGLQHYEKGSVIYIDPKTEKEENLKEKNPRQIREMGVRLSFVPEDRLGMGLVGNMNLVDNVLLRSYEKGRSPFLDKHNPKELTNKIVEELQIATESVNVPVRTLSGGNVQKVLVGREISASPKLLMTAYPVRGLDINSSYLIYDLLNKQKEKGTAVIFVGEDLDVLIALCDRIMVLSSGECTGIVDARSIKKEELGMLMVKSNDDLKNTAPHVLVDGLLNQNKEETEVGYEY